MWQFAIFAGDKMGLGLIKLGMRLPFASAHTFPCICKYRFFLYPIEACGGNRNIGIIVL